MCAVGMLSYLHVISGSPPTTEYPAQLSFWKGVMGLDADDEARIIILLALSRTQPYT